MRAPAGEMERHLWEMREREPKRAASDQPCGKSEETARNGGRHT